MNFNCTLTIWKMSTISYSQQSLDHCTNFLQTITIVNMAIFMPTTLKLDHLHVSVLKLPHTLRKLSQNLSIITKVGVWPPFNQTGIIYYPTNVQHKYDKSGTIGSRLTLLPTRNCTLEPIWRSNIPSMVPSIYSMLYCRSTKCTSGK